MPKNSYHTQLVKLAEELQTFYSSCTIVGHNSTEDDLKHYWIINTSEANAIESVIDILNDCGAKD